MRNAHHSNSSARAKTAKGGKQHRELGRKSKLLLEDYAGFLREVRGVKPESVAQMVSFGRRFLDYAACGGIASMADLSPDEVQTFLVMQSEGCARETVLGFCWKLRRFLSFLHFRGETRSDLSSVIVRPRTYRRESCPGYLTRAEIEHVISRIDRRASDGKRDYAVIMLLATYGLRGAEIIGLRLEDIEWRTLRLHIRNRKGGDHLVHPLTPEVAHALLVYLKKNRPKTSDRHVFVSSKPPYAAYK